jgi:hypothetical protein
MNPVVFGLVIEVLVMIGKAVPKIIPGIKDILDMLKGEAVEDISDEEAIARIKAAQDALP